jgi:hypothetical protein
MRRIPASRTVLMLLLSLPIVATTPIAAAASELEEPPPFKVRHFDLRELVFDELPFTNEGVQRLPAYPPMDADGIPLFRWRDGRIYYNASRLAINGMKRIDNYRDTGDVSQLEQALLQAEQLRKMKIVRHDAWWLPFWFDYRPAGLEGPWFDAMAQGLALSFFIRLHRVTGDEAHMEAAEKVFDSFMRLGKGRTNGPRLWVAYVAKRGYLWLVHYPNEKPDHVLNVHLHATNGLYEYWQHTRSPQARQLLEGALTTMRDLAGLYRREGRVSFYGLRSRTKILKYHRVHVWQLRLLARMTSDGYFSDLADAMERDQSARGHVQGRPAAVRHGNGIGSAPKLRRIAPYPFVSPEFGRAA